MNRADPGRHRPSGPARSGRPQPGRAGPQRSGSQGSAPPRTQLRLGPLVLLIGLLLVAGGVAALWWTNRGVSITIGLEESPGAIAASLHDANADYDENEVVALLTGPGPAAVPGTYPIDTALDTTAQVRALQAAWVDADPGITFPEGFTVSKMATRIAKNRWQYTADELIAASNGLTVDPRFARPADVTSVEGLLFPSTYAVGNNLDASAAMGQMLVEMQSLVFDQQGIEAGAQQLGRTPYEVMIVASLIEKEAKTAVDRPLIARVIYNRIAADMLLQIDASNYYQAPEGASFAELRETDTPYNLYIHKGLPPTPIANPGLASIEAALNPAPPLDPSDERCVDLPAEQCQLLFYVIGDADGNHKFAVTHDQHVVNVEAARAAGLL